MIFNARVETPANTLESSPLESVLKATSGLVYQMELYFPPGSSGLMGVQIRNQNVSLYPRNRDEWFIGDNMSLRFPDLYELYLDSNILEIFTYNLDTAYCHVVQFSIGIVSKQDFIDHFLPGATTRALIESMSALTDSIASGVPAKNPTLLERITGSKK